MNDPRAEAEHRIQNGEDRQLLRQFREAAWIADRFDELLHQVNTLTNALGIQTSALEEEKAKTRRLERELAEARGETQHGKPLAVFFQATRSMTESFGSVVGDISYLKTVREAVLKLSEDGANVRTVFWGDKVLHPVDMRDTPAVARYAEIMPDAGNDFQPVIDYLESRFTTEPDNFVIISDGICYAGFDAPNRAERLLKENPKTTLDFVVMSDNDRTPVSNFALDLIGQFSAQVSFQRIGSGDSVTAALETIAARRTAQPERPTLPPLSSIQLKPL